MACKTKKYGEGVLECKVWRRCNLSVPFTTYVRSNTFLGNKKVFRFNFGGFGAAATKPTGKNGEKIEKIRKKWVGKARTTSNYPHVKDIVQQTPCYSK